MRITYRLTCDDYYEAAQTSKRERRWISFSAFLSLWVMLVFASIRSRGVHSEPVYAVFGFLLVLFVVLDRLAVWLGKVFFMRACARKADSLDKEFIVNISESGISKPDSLTSEDWSSFSKHKESANDFVLYRSNLIYVILPKRAFALDDLDTFRRLLKTKLATRTW